MTYKYKEMDQSISVIVTTNYFQNVLYFYYYNNNKKANIVTHSIPADVKHFEGWWTCAYQQTVLASWTEGQLQNLYTEERSLTFMN